MSSRRTFASKFGPLAFAAIWGIAGIAGLFGANICGTDCGPAERAFPLVVFCILAPVTWFIGRSLKQVAIEDGMVVISDFRFRSIRIDPRHITAVRMHHHFYHYASVEFDIPTLFGQRITFIPADALPSPSTYADGEMPDSARTLVRLAARAKYGDASDIEAAERQLRLRGL